MNKTLILCLIVLFGSVFSSESQPIAKVSKPDLSKTKFYTSSRPWSRWWWFAAEIRKSDVSENLSWLKNNGFGGVEIAWVYPLNRMKKDTVNYTPRQEWLSPEWSSVVSYAKHCADSLGMGCDFTFGSLWPFGDINVPFEEATMNMKEPEWRQVISASWDYPKKGYVIDHLSRNAFYNYAKRTGEALQPALKGSVSGIFCDSWEVETRHLYTKGFTEKFRARYNYSVTDYTDSLYSNRKPYSAVRYDYMKLLSEYVIEEFYKPFTQKSHELGAYSRVQCSGAPCDIISAYATVDIPESEALLYEPAYSNIVASAAGLSGKTVVSAETFTCLYGWPNDSHSKEQTADLKLLADAVFANGVNQVIWHGKPLNPAGLDTVKFYASVHVGKSGALAQDLPSFNNYLEKVSGYLKNGVPASRVAVYLPTEDTWVAGELPVGKQFIWAWGEYEHRYTYLPSELKAWRPLWINGEFLGKARYREGVLQAGNLTFSACYVDVRYMDISALRRLVELASAGLPVCLKRMPSEPGLNTRDAEYKILLEKLTSLKNVKGSWPDMQVTPLVTGSGRTDYWCRKTEEGLTFFFANPHAQGLKFPLAYGQSLNNSSDTVRISFNYEGKTIPYTLIFKPYQSVMITIGNDGKITPVNIEYTPDTPVFKPRIKNGKEKWEVGYQPN
jgi:hypothetical protein